MANLNTAQTAVLVASEVVPGLLILLPAATGGIAKLLEMYGDLAGVTLPAFLPHVLALMVVSSIAGVSKVWGLAGREAGQPCGREPCAARRRAAAVRVAAARKGRLHVAQRGTPGRAARCCAAQPA